MIEPIHVEEPKGGKSFIASQSDYADEESQTCITGSETLVATMVLLLACAGLAVLAHLLV
jgi:hypothetical protein